MLLADSESRIGIRSTKRLNEKGIRRIFDTVCSFESLKRYEERRRPKRGKRTYSFFSLVTLWIYIEMLGLTYDADISRNKLKAMGMPRAADGYLRPSPARISDFISNEWPGIAPEAMREYADAVLASQRDKLFTIDSTPMEASRYSGRYSHSPHYGIRMGKAHIIMCNGYPLVLSFTDANDPDCGQLVPLLNMLPDGIRGTVGFVSDGSYPSFENYSAVYEKLDVVMASNPSKSSVFHEEATLQRMQRLYASFWKEEDYRPKASNRRILRFLIRHGKTAETGQFLRNLDMRRGWVSGMYALQRRICETVHRSMKRWMDFDARGLRRESETQRKLMKFFTAQVLCAVFDPYSVPGMP